MNELVKTKKRSGERGPDKSMRRPRRLGRPKGKNQGKALTELQKEAVVQIYALTGSKAETARQTGTTPATVRKYLRMVPNAEIQRRRAEIQYGLAGKFTDKTVEVLDSITPESLKSASLGQKSMAAGIFADKVVNITRNASELEATTQQNRLFTPASLDEFVKMLREKAKSLDLVHIDLTGGDANLSSRVDAAIAEAEVLDSKTSPVQSEDEFDGLPDNPTGTSGPVDGT